MLRAVVVRCSIWAWRRSISARPRATNMLTKVGAMSRMYKPTPIGAYTRTSSVCSMRSFRSVMRCLQATRPDDRPVIRPDDHLGTGAHQRAYLIAERGLEADDGRDLVARDREDPGTMTWFEIARHPVERMHPALQLGAKRHVLAEGHEVALGVGALDGPVG